MSNTPTMFGMIALFAVGMIFSSPLAASAVVSYPDDNGNFLELKKAIIDIQSDPEGDVITDIVFKTRGDIPQDGSGGNFGYGVVTLVNGTLNVIATTSHPELGIVDSELQEDEFDPVFHNHYVALGTDEANCDDNPAVSDLSFESPGELIVKGNTAILKNLPPSALGQLDPDLTNGTDVDVITPGADIRLVASFLLKSVFNQQGVIQAVCVTEIMPIEPADQRTVIFGEKDFKSDYPKPGYENRDDGYVNYQQQQQYDNNDNNNNYDSVNENYKQYDNNDNNNNYDSVNDRHSKYPTENNKYECQKGPFEGFFVSSVEFCKRVQK